MNYNLKFPRRAALCPARLMLVSLAVTLASCATSAPIMESLPKMHGCVVDAPRICQSLTGAAPEPMLGSLGRYQAESSTPFLVRTLKFRIPRGSTFAVKCEINPELEALTYAWVAKVPRLTQADADYLQSQGFCTPGAQIAVPAPR